DLETHRSVGAGLLQQRKRRQIALDDPARHLRDAIEREDLVAHGPRVLERADHRARVRESDQLAREVGVALSRLKVFRELAAEILRFTLEQLPIPVLVAAPHDRFAGLDHAVADERSDLLVGTLPLHELDFEGALPALL